MSQAGKELSRVLKNKQLLMLVGAGLVLIVILVQVINKTKTNLAVNRQLKSQVEKLEDKRRVLEGVDSILVTERVKKMEAVFPSKKPVVQLLAALSQLSAEHNLSFGGVTLRPGALSEAELQAQASKKSTKKTTGSSGLLDLQFGFKVGGDFNNISGFLKDLENVAPLMKVDEVTLSIKTNPLFIAQEVLVQADISVSSFYQPPPEKLGSVSTPVSLLSREDEALLNKLFGFKTFQSVVALSETGKEDLFAQGL